MERDADGLPHISALIMAGMAKPQQRIYSGGFCSLKLTVNDKRGDSADALSARDATTGTMTPRSERLFCAGLRVRLGNGTFKVVAQSLTFRIEGSARYIYIVQAR